MLELAGGRNLIRINITNTNFLAVFKEHLKLKVKL
jgi:hypothetical protein